jgi:hypothetical protein
MATWGGTGSSGQHQAGTGIWMLSLHEATLTTVLAAAAHANVSIDTCEKQWNI